MYAKYERPAATAPKARGSVGSQSDAAVGKAFRAPSLGSRSDGSRDAGSRPERASPPRSPARAKNAFD